MRYSLNYEELQTVLQGLKAVVNNSPSRVFMFNDFETCSAPNILLFGFSSIFNNESSSLRKTTEAHYGYICFSVTYDLRLQNRSFDVELILEVELLLEVKLLLEVEFLLEVEILFELEL